VFYSCEKTGEATPTTPTKKAAAASPAKKKETPKKAEAKAEIPPKSPGKYVLALPAWRL
jgi:cell division septation protein DedD